MRDDLLVAALDKRRGAHILYPHVLTGAQPDSATFRGGESCYDARSLLSGVVGVAARSLSNGISHARAQVMPESTVPGLADDASRADGVDVLSSAHPRLEMRGVVKTFPGVRALSDVNFDVRPGEIMGLIGENGAGKSTLMKVVSGAYIPDEGAVLLNGTEINLRRPADALAIGIKVIYQEIDLIPHLTVRENIFLGHMPTRRGLLDIDEMRREAKKHLLAVGFDIDPDAILSTLSVARQHIVAIAQALATDAQVLVLDEPSAVIPEKDMGSLYKLLHRLAGEGVAIVYISHHLQEVIDISNRITILRDGELVAVVDSHGRNERELADMMVGRTLDDYYPVRERDIGDVRLEITDVSTDGLKTQDLDKVSLSVRAGEIVGVYGLVGAGRTELAKVIFGAHARSSGEIRIDGEPVRLRDPQEAILNGVGLLVEDRKDEGLDQDASVMCNITMANYPAISRNSWIRKRVESSMAKEYGDKLQIKAPSLLTRTRSLSGGNQQKVVLAKWLCRDAQILIFDEPTRGVDVGAKTEIYRLMNELVGRGVAILMMSAELNEIIGMSDRMIVMKQGQIAGEVQRKDATEERLVSLAMGVEHSDNV